MYNYFSYENNIIMVDLIVRSTNDLVPLVLRNSKLDGTIDDTITLILKFLGRIIDLMPDVLANQNEYNTKKLNTKDAFSNVLETWANYKEKPTDFRYAWNDFYYFWRDIHKDLLYLQRSKHTIFLSMN